MNKTETILCAAIWLKSPSFIPHQPDNIEHGTVYCGYRHCSILQQINRADRIGWGIVQGFLTSHNRFVDRKEAFIIAKDSQQFINEGSCTIDNILFSEDLY